MKAKQKMYKGKDALLIRGLCTTGLFSKGKTGKPSVLELHFSLHKTHTISLLRTRSNTYNNSNSSWWNNEKQKHEHTRRRVSRAIPAKSSAARRLLCDEELERLRWRRRWSRCFRRDRRDPPLEDSEAAAADSSFELSCPIFSSLAFALAHRESQNCYSLFQFLYVSRYSDSILRKMTMVLDWKPKERLLRLLFLFAERTRKKERDK